MGFANGAQYNRKKIIKAAKLKNNEKHNAEIKIEKETSLRIILRIEIIERSHEHGYTKDI